MTHDVDLALRFAARAAVAWCHSEEMVTAVVDRLTSLRDAGGWIDRVRQAHGLAPLKADQVLACFGEDTSAWLPGAPQCFLHRNDTATPDALSLAAEGIADLQGELEQKVMRRVQLRFSSMPPTKGAAAYREFRRTLVEGPVRSHADMLQVALLGDLEPGQLFERLSQDCLWKADGGPQFYPCPRCRWPMTAARDRQGMRTSLQCRSDVCQKQGALYAITPAGFSALGKVALPSPQFAEGCYRLKRGLWRYTVLPGLEELALYARLSEMKDVKVTLWPDCDRCDLSIETPHLALEVDVKDHVSPRFIIEFAHNRTPTAPLHIVVPQHRQSQLQVLKNACQQLPNIEFMTSAQLVRKVKQSS